MDDTESQAARRFRTVRDIRFSSWFSWLGIWDDMDSLSPMNPRANAHMAGKLGYVLSSKPRKSSFGSRNTGAGGGDTAVTYRFCHGSEKMNPLFPRPTMQTCVHRPFHSTLRHLTHTHHTLPIPLATSLTKSPTSDYLYLAKTCARVAPHVLIFLQQPLQLQQRIGRQSRHPLRPTSIRIVLSPPPPSETPEPSRPPRSRRTGGRRHRRVPLARAPRDGSGASRPRPRHWHSHADSGLVQIRWRRHPLPVAEPREQVRHLIQRHRPVEDRHRRRQRLHLQHRIVHLAVFRHDLVRRLVLPRAHFSDR
ncbi:hypothetical protein BC826DRAFT_82323 [Russula brevipes]|nr:hypothetical protein BC826DRAFT_82323 [Russula brevipes]